MSQNLVISIGRQFGSGGRKIGKLVAEKLGIGYYDSELLCLAAKEVGFDESCFEQVDEKSEVLSFFRDVQSFFSVDVVGPNENVLSGEGLFKVQSDVIKNVAEKAPCVIMGRCSDYVLRNNPNCISVFLMADREDKIQRVSARLGVAAHEAEKIIRETNKKRASYYNRYTGKEWGVSSSYQLCVNVSSLGEERAAEFICSYVRMRGLV